MRDKNPDSLSNKLSLENMSSEIEKFGLSKHIRELDDFGFTIIPQETLGLSDNWFEEIRDAILKVAYDRTGVRFKLDADPSATFHGRPDEIGHIILSHLIYEDQPFERVVTHPVKRILMNHLLGFDHRLSVSDGWIKWKTPRDWVGEETTGFHADQNLVPHPWNWKTPHIANMNWILTDYSKDDGALAVVPGSHIEGRPPELGEALPLAVPVEAARGSLVIFNGCLWHGSYRKKTSGLRVTMLGQHCREYMLPFQDFKSRVSEARIAASADQLYLRSLLREDERAMFPYAKKHPIAGG